MNDDIQIVHAAIIKRAWASPGRSSSSIADLVISAHQLRQNHTPRLAPEEEALPATSRRARAKILLGALDLFLPWRAR